MRDQIFDRAEHCLSTIRVCISIFSYAGIS
jgi:hypothetical protein